MKFDEIRRQIENVPFITSKNAKILYDLIIKENARNILELGIAHGAGTCYMAAALDELGGGKITSVDLIESEQLFDPSPEELINKVKLSDYVDIVRMQTGYNWFLHDEIVRSTSIDICNTKYDLCIIDGPKNWTIDGFAFFLVDKLLNEDGWIIFDDYDWTYAGADSERSATDGITHRELSEAERQTPQIKDVFELLVKQHTNYSDLYIYPDTGWAIARKSVSSDKNYTVEYKETNKDVLVALKGRVKKLLKKINI